MIGLMWWWFRAWLAQLWVPSIIAPEPEPVTAWHGRDGHNVGDRWGLDREVRWQTVDELLAECCRKKTTTSE